jgi:hypothetical protein
MGKNTFFTGQPILTQILALIPRSIVQGLITKYNCDRYCKKFTAYDHLVSMLFSSFHRCSSLRELITGLQANANRLQHLGLKYTPRRSTLADANKRRTSDFFGTLFHELYKHHYGVLPDSLSRKSEDDKLFIIDSTTISLFSNVMKGMTPFDKNGRRKGGAKAHMLVRAKDQLPCFVYLSNGTENDKIFLPMVTLPARSIVVMDMGYLSYKPLIKWTEQKVMWVTRLHPRSYYSYLESREVTELSHKRGVREDSIIALGSPSKAKKVPIQTVRLIRFYDSELKKEFTFISNNLKARALTICRIYQKRWGVELLFKRVKQNFNFQDFLGDNENAIKIQIWCGLIADLLVKIIKDKVNLDRKQKWSFKNIAGLIRQHLTTYIDLYAFLFHPEKAILQYVKRQPDYQLKLYST